MKCKYCNAEVAPNAIFCTVCGGDLSKLDKCVNCGEFIDKGAMVCPHCGTEQPQFVSTQKGSSEKRLRMALFGVLIAGAIAGGIYFFCLSGQSNPELAESSPIVMADDESHDVDTANGERLPTADEVERNFNGEYSAELRRLEGLAWKEPGFGEISYMGVPCSDCEVKSLKLKEINVTSPTTASATAVVNYGNEDYLETQTNSVKLILEDGHWVIDDYDGWHDELTQHFSQANETTDDDQAEEFSEMSKGFYVEVNYGYYFYIPRFLREGEQQGELAKNNSALYENNGYSLHISVDESDIEGQFWMYDKMRSRNGEYDVYEESMITKNKDYWKVDDNSGSILLIMQSKDNKKCGTMYFTYPDGGKAIVEEAIEKSIRKTRENDV